MHLRLAGWGVAVLGDACSGAQCHHRINDSRPCAEKWGMQEWILHPGLGSEHRLDVDDDYCTIYVTAHSLNPTFLAGQVLQCWTDLPTDESVEQGQWRAYDVGEGGESSRNGVLLTRKISLDISKVVDHAAYGLTWRLLKRDDAAHEAIRWLGDAQSDVKLILYKGSRSIKPLMSLRVEKVSSAKNGVTRHPIDVGKPLSSVSGGMVLERTLATWQTARQISCAEDVSEYFLANLLVLRHRSDSNHSGTAVTVLYPLGSAGASASLARIGHQLVLQTKALSGVQADAWAIIATGELSDTHRLIRQTVKQARVVLGRRDETPREALSYRSSPLVAGDALKLCTWESFGAGKHRPTLEKLKELLHAIPDHVPVDTLLIDDGWQHVSEREHDGGRKRLLSFDLVPSLMPSPVADKASPFESTRMHGLVSDLLKVRKDVRHVGVWMTLAGYWDGLSDDEHWKTRYGPLQEVTLNWPTWPADRPRTWLLPAQDKVQVFYLDYFTAIQQAGVTFVKVDDQADWEWIVSSADDPTFDRLQHAWRALVTAGETVFGIASVIHCMAMGQQMLNGPLALLSATPERPICLRISDDTFPHVPETHTWHVYRNAMQICMTSAIPGLLSDADMLTTTMEGETGEDWAAYHLAFRCCLLSAPIWLSDDAEGLRGERCGQLLETVTVPIKDVSRSNTLGKPSVLQSTTLPNALPLPSCLMDGDLTGTSDGTALKLGSWAGAVGLISVWNVRKRPARVIDMITVADVKQALTDVGAEKIHQEASYVVCSLDQQNVALIDGRELMRSNSSVLASKPLFPITLAPSHYDIFTVVKTHPVLLPGLTHAACLGLLGKSIGICALQRLEVWETNDGRGLRANLLYAGRCAFIVAGYGKVPKVTCSIDSVPVSPSHVAQTRAGPDSMLLITIDMLAHLQSASRADPFVSVGNHWSVDVQFRVA